MQIHNFNQGSDAWNEFRALHFGSSEAASMLGISKLTSRSELLKRKHSGIKKEFSDYVQREILDYGHEVEAKARPIVEALIGEELSPVTASLGKLSASSDGVTFMGDIGWENKQFNKEHFELVKSGELPEVHWPQCQQVIYVHGLEKLFFTISDGTPENTVGVWVYPDAEKVKALLNGWAQLEKDLAVYVPVEEVEKPKAQPIMALPSLAIQIKGEVVQSNLKEFKVAATALIASIKTELVTDDDFVNAEKMVKFCKDAEENIELTKKAAIAQTSSIDELMRTMDFISDELRTKRLMLDKLVKSQKESIKLNAVTKAKNDIGAYLLDAERELSPIRLQVNLPNVAEAISGLKTIASMHSKLGDAVANAKILIDGVARDIRNKLAWFKLSAIKYEFLFSDLNALIQKNEDDFQAAVNLRIREHKETELAKEAKIVADAEAALLAKQAAEKVEVAEPVKLVPQVEVTNEAPVNHVTDTRKLGATINTQYFAGATPTANELVFILATALHVDEQMAHKWLLEADFTQYKIAA